MTLITPLEQIAPLSPKTLASFHKLGLFCVRDLLENYPVRYEDFSHVSLINEIRAGGDVVTVRGTLMNVENRSSWKRHMSLVEASLQDATGEISAIWFNQPFLIKVLREGAEYYFSGKVGHSPEGALQLQNPVFERADDTGDTVHTARIVPMYGLSGNLTQKQVRYLVSKVIPLARLSFAQQNFGGDWLPFEIKRNMGLLPLAQALQEIHFPSSQEKLTQAQRRLKFDELFLIQLQAKKLRATLHALKAPVVPFFKDVTQHFVKRLPFTLTNDQKKASWQIIGDLAKPYPMNRLLEGEVGSGKTLVAALALLNVMQAGLQGVVLVPTEILARQHFEKFVALFKGTPFRVALCTAGEAKMNTPHLFPLPQGERREQKKSLSLEGRGQGEGALSHPQLRSYISQGLVHLIIGTHALLSDKVMFANLGLVIVDEQHRFGVNQRATLRRKNIDLVPHLLSMTATPIPRTLSLVLYGDLDISIIKELPAGRKKIETKIVDPTKRDAAYAFVREQIQMGRQAFVLCPRIEENGTELRMNPNITNTLPIGNIRNDSSFGSNSEVKAAKAEYKKLSEEIFPDLKIGLLHGKLVSKTRAKVMEDFVAQKYDILVATSMVEVGVDVPNATVMMIEGADHFGLAQLHQLRGRVGRSVHASYCFLLPGELTEEGSSRLAAFEKSNDGFELAEQDLKLRGPGERWGMRQAGFADFKIATLFDFELIERAKEWAEKIITADPQLNRLPLLKQKLTSHAQSVHLE